MQDASTIFERLNDLAGLDFSYCYLARLDLREGQRDEAIMHFRTALRHAEQIDSPDADESREADYSEFSHEKQGSGGRASDLGWIKELARDEHRARTGQQLARGGNQSNFLRLSTSDEPLVEGMDRVVATQGPKRSHVQPCSEETVTMA